MSAPVDVIVFTIGGVRYGAEASQVLRVEGGEQAVTLTSLAAPAKGDRALVFQTAEGEGRLRIDGVQGIRPVAVDTLRRLPKAAPGAEYAVGVWLDGEQAILLLDLAKVPQEQGRH